MNAPEKIKYGKCSNCRARELEAELWVVNKKILCSDCKAWLKKTPEEKIKEIDKRLNGYIHKDATEVKKILKQREQLCQ